MTGVTTRVDQKNILFQFQMLTARKKLIWLQIKNIFSVMYSAHTFQF